MKTQYKALKPIGPWMEGQIVGDLPQVKIKQLLDDGVIEAIKPEVKVEVKPKTKEVPANG
ncbi:hypothetical protein ACNFX6_10745 [Acinetobacter johnsonii]|jgi:hypothetical protein|uniref:Uncharacterized protein n=1 Tax=Acinetobacter johnsonii TaxID=40214 RepID=A0A1R7Q9A1_ACIJO|nr:MULTISPECIES: hypothetical protein [Acinetobacter]MDN5629204.1 hypothetical protein [Lactococcus sp.]MDH1276164.1 hypothetical protein [Acinetobacter johnsonii]PZO85406.1 MAG: hypothetical protein DI631_16790 [Acinetobacter johnsonii]WEH95199.1 hypothetical protein PYR90_02210 [Acinetobacter johnsonii]WQN49496.1 hypothetical protein U6038_09530 [Acinetobacter johnsonii]